MAAERISTERLRALVDSWAAYPLSNKAEVDAALRYLLDLLTAPEGMEGAEIFVSSMTCVVPDIVDAVKRRDAQHVLRAKRLEDRIAEAERILRYVDADPRWPVARDAIDAALAAQDKFAMMNDAMKHAILHGRRVAARRLMLAQFDARRMREALEKALRQLHPPDAEVIERCSTCAGYALLAARPAPDALDKVVEALRTIKTKLDGGEPSVGDFHEALEAVEETLRLLGEEVP